MNITVYLGSSMGDHPLFAQAARDMAHVILRGGHTLVYGGCSTGLMGILARTVLEGGGSAIGIIPHFLTQVEPPQQGLTELHVVETMTARKAGLIERGEAFVALPGGPGTLEEISEVISDLKLWDVGGQPDIAPGGCVFYNLEGYYNPLKQQFAIMHEHGFMSTRLLARLAFPETAAELAACFA